MARRNETLGRGQPAHGTTRRVAVGALLWASSIQFFLAQVVVALGWETPYRVATRYISDLGNTACAAYPVGSSIHVCSPWHAGMNASFLLLGLTMAAGAVLIARAFRAGRALEAGLLLISVAGLGVFLVGLFPENENIEAHTVGAGLNFICGNLGMIVLGVVGSGSRRFDRVSQAMGILGLAGTVLFVKEIYLGLGQGGMERVAAYPLTIWLTGAGVYFWRIGRPDSGNNPGAVPVRGD
jgi:hypothetical membrane protein